MTKPYSYTRNDLAKLAGGARNRIDVDVKRGFDPSSIEEVAVWLAKNGPPEIRRRMAEPLLEDVFEGLFDVLRDQLLAALFKRNFERRGHRATKIALTKRSRKKHQRTKSGGDTLNGQSLKTP